MSNKKSRRNLRRMAERKGISYSDAIKRHFRVESMRQLDKNLVYSLHKNTILNRDKYPEEPSACPLHKMT